MQLNNLHYLKDGLQWTVESEWFMVGQAVYSIMGQPCNVREDKAKADKSSSQNWWWKIEIGKLVPISTTVEGKLYKNNRCRAQGTSDLQ